MGTRGCKQGKFWSLWFLYFIWFEYSYFVCWHFIWRFDLSGRNPIFANTFGTAPYSPRGDRSNWTEFGVNPQLMNDVLGVLWNSRCMLFLWPRIWPPMSWFQLLFSFGQFGFLVSARHLLMACHSTSTNEEKQFQRRKNNPEEDRTCMFFVRTKSSIVLLKSCVNWMCMPKWFLIASISIPNFASKSNYWPWHIFQFSVQQLFNYKI